VRGIDLQPVFALTGLKGNRGFFNAFDGFEICFVPAMSAGEKTDRVDERVDLATLNGV
jgi:hypothetical protein